MNAINIKHINLSGDPGDYHTIQKKHGVRYNATQRPRLLVIRISGAHIRSSEAVFVTISQPTEKPEEDE